MIRRSSSAGTCRPLSITARSRWRFRHCEINLARSLAEQNLVALDGETARFRAGGEFPVPAATLTFGRRAGGLVHSIRRADAVRSLHHRPRRIRLQVGATVSTLDPSLGTSIGGSAGAGAQPFPGSTRGTFQTTVELRSGQTFAVAGLTQTTFGATTVRVPFFGDLPIVGSLAGENQTSHGEQEVMILITPETHASAARVCHSARRRLRRV